ncbi:MAG: metallophosphoesterase family protein [Planctomycetes bacterium]|nr:metallophosphoesterase family protein [Planctomycetota bacterium]
MKAIVSDIHSNVEALLVALKDIDKKGIKNEDIYCLGDVIGYGPDPVSCLNIAMNFNFVLLGNHEEAVVNGAFGFHPAAKRAIDWTRKQIKPQVFSSGHKKRRWEFVRDLPLKIVKKEILLNGLIFVHGSPRDPTMEYILKVDTEDYFGEVPPKMKEIFDIIDGPCFVGHSHVPCIITEDCAYHSIEEVGYEFKLEEGEKYIINIGSVGQPRDHDNKLCYMTIDDDAVVRWHRLEYDHKTTAEKIRAIPDLDNRNADRLEKGL